MFKHKFGVSNLKTSADLKKVKIGSSAKERAAEVWSTDEQDALHVSILDSDLKKEKYSSSLINPFGVYGGGEVPTVDCRADEQLFGSEEILIDDAVDQLVAELAEEHSTGIDLESKEEKAEDSVKGGVDADQDKPRQDVIVDKIYISHPSCADEIPLVQECVSGSAALSKVRSEVINETPVENNGQEAPHKLVGIYSPNLSFITSVQKELEILGEAWVYCFDGSAGIESLSSAPKLRSIDTWIINLTDDDECEMLDAVLDESADANTMYLSGSVLSKSCKSKLKDFLEVE